MGEEEALYLSNQIYLGHGKTVGITPHIITHIILLNVLRKKRKRKQGQKEFINTYIYELKRSDYRWFHLRSFSSRCRSIATVTFPLKINDRCFNSVTADKVTLPLSNGQEQYYNRSKEIEHLRQLQTSKHQDKFSSSLHSKCRSPN